VINRVVEDVCKSYSPPGLEKGKFLSVSWEHLSHGEETPSIAFGARSVSKRPVKYNLAFLFNHSTQKEIHQLK
jgi:hypothetical protein